MPGRLRKGRDRTCPIECEYSYRNRRSRSFARQFAHLEVRLQKKRAEHDPAIAAILATIRELGSPQRQSQCSRSANDPNGVLERPLRDDNAEAFREFDVDDQLENQVLDGHTSWLLTVEDPALRVQAPVGR